MHIPPALLAAVSLIVYLHPGAALAQQRPLLTEDPETVGAGRILIEGGLDYGRNVRYPTSGLEGHLLRAPLLGVSVGISSIAELQLDGGLHNRLRITDRDPSAPFASVVTVDGDLATSMEDLVVGTKVRLLSEGLSRPAFGVRFATRLPNASNESGLGLDTLDFFATLLAAKTIEHVRIAGNLGLGILGDPERGDRQNDVLTYGIAFARAMTGEIDLVGEIHGRVNTRSGMPPPGTESRSMLRMGGRYTVGTWRADAALLFGITSPDPSVGITAGFTYVFQAFQLP